MFFEALPYRNHAVLKEKIMHVTRFIALAHVSNSKKERYVYGFNIEPLASTEISSLLHQPPTAVDCPYRIENRRGSNSNSYFYGEQKRKDRPREVPPDGYVCRVCNTPGHWIQNCPNKHVKRAKRDNAPCWFCLSSPDVEKHLVVSIGDCVYSALAKGGLVEDHLLLLPISHVKSVSELDNDSYDELVRFKDAVAKYFDRVSFIFSCFCC